MEEVHSDPVFPALSRYGVGRPVATEKSSDPLYLNWKSTSSPKALAAEIVSGTTRHS
jgi:hypothetical protein